MDWMCLNLVAQMDIQSLSEIKFSKTYDIESLTQKNIYLLDPY